MATVLLSAAGAAIGGSIGGTIFGLSAAAAGRFAGAIIGRSIDQRLLGEGTDIVERGRVERLRLTGSGEGDGMANVYGKMRVSGQMIWATEFTETVNVTGGGKGGPPKPKTANYSYSVSVAIALCEGVITHVGRIWADGNELAVDDITMRVYRGTESQLPDPKMEAIEGPGEVPAYRGTAYVVIEDLELGPFGNRVPQFTFEVARPAQLWQEGAKHDPAYGVRGVALLPGSGEYALATTPVNKILGPGQVGIVNVNTPSGKSDFLTALDTMTGELRGCGATSLIVSWFGDDLRAGDCKIKPKVEEQLLDSSNMPWQVADLDRIFAERVPLDGEGKPVYGGTPSDQSVIEAILALQAAGQDVMYYPFILMEQMVGNGLPDPYSDASNQAILPWRGRITTAKAPGQPGSTDGTQAAVGEVAAFFGAVTAADFKLKGEDEEEQPATNQFEDILAQQGFAGFRQVSPVEYTGPADDWGYSRFILHQAMLCKAAGGVESFCIGSEMRGLTQIRGPGNSFPAVDKLITLLADVRTILGPNVKITYAADWSEYFGYQPGDGDRFFHLDPLWAQPDIDFIGIDNYMPLSDWRDGEEHLDAGAGTIYDLDYLMSNIEGGEGFDWYYETPEARENQNRTEITDGEHNEPWVWRYKDFRSWWLSAHHERIGGVRQQQSTDWIPESKPIRFTEYGCASIDKGTNQPNKFLDPKSSESRLPYHSNARQDELMQMQYLRAMAAYWSDPENNEISEIYDGPMLDWDHSYVWAWDARPYPFFPNDREQWSDGDNHARGHWITGRASARSLANVVDEICHRTGLRRYDVDDLYAYVRGYVVEDVSDARGALQPLALRYGVDAIDRGGLLDFQSRDGRKDFAVDRDTLVRESTEMPLVEEVRASDAELAGRVRLRFIESDGDYEVIAEEAILPEDETHSVSISEIPIAMTRAEGRQTVERWLSESRLARDTVQLTLPPSQMDRGAGDVICLQEDGGEGYFRIDRVEQMGLAQRVNAVRVDKESYIPIDIPDLRGSTANFTPPAPVTPVFMDLPLMSGQEVPHAPHLAVTGTPWPGYAAVYSSTQDSNYILNTLIYAPTPVGITETPLKRMPSGQFDLSEPLRVKMINGQLASVEEAAMLNGSNLCAIGNGSPDRWELFQFRDATTVDLNTYELSYRLRGQLGTEHEMPAEWPVGSVFVRLNGTPEQIILAEAALGQERHYRVGPGNRFYTDPSFRHAVLAFEGIGLRPYSPVHMKAEAAGNGGVEISWVRRTRISGDRWETPEVPLGEESEQYILRILQGNTLRREEFLNAPRFTYTSAMQSDDGVPGLFAVEVAQVSAKVGAGPYAKLTVPNLG